MQKYCEGENQNSIEEAGKRLKLLTTFGSTAEIKEAPQENEIFHVTFHATKLFKFLHTSPIKS
jgi:hypothetical protein